MKKKLLAAIAGAIAAVAFWRRKTVKDDAARVAQASKGAAVKVTEAGKGAATKVSDRVRQRGATGSGDELSPADTVDLREGDASLPPVHTSTN